MINIKFINHSSVLIQEGDSFVLTDPWYEKVAFGSWLPVPACSIHPSYLVALSKQVENFTIVISHGHDDHLDDDFLSLFPSNIKIIIPKYRSIGLLRRLNNIGLNNIYQVDEEGLAIAGFTFKSYINPDICPDDAIISIAGKDYFIVHANDNWQKLESEPLSRISNDASNYEENHRLYMSQCNLADGWPNIYRDYSSDEKLKIHFARIQNIILNTIQNASDIGCKYFLNYAGHATAFVNNNLELKKTTSYVTNDFVSEIKAIDRVKILDMIPGDSFDFKTVTKQFSNIRLDDQVLKETTCEFYESHGVTLKCDYAKKVKNLDGYLFKSKMDQFLLKFDDFVMKRVVKSGYNSDIVGFKIILKGSSCTSEVVIGGGDSFQNKTVIFYISEDRILKMLLSGEIIWENLYIGYEAEVETEPPQINARAPVRWLASFGYVYKNMCKNV